MTFNLTESEIMAGADRYDLKALARWKMYKGDDGKVHLKVVPEQGKPEMYEVEPSLTFKDVDGNVVNPDYWIATWHKGMKQPECVIRIGDMDGRGTFEVNEPKKRMRSGYAKVKSYGFDSEEKQDMEDEDGGA